MIEDCTMVVGRKFVSSPVREILANAPQGMGIQSVAHQWSHTIERIKARKLDEKFTQVVIFVN